MKIILSIIFAVIIQNSIGQEIHYVSSENSDSVTTYYAAYVINCQKSFLDTLYKLNFETEKKTEYRIYFSNKSKIVFVEDFEDDTLTRKTYYGNGKLMQIRKYVNNFIVLNKRYYRNGILEYNFNDFRDTLVKRQTYWENGQLAWYGEIHGINIYNIEKRWYPNGKLAEETEHTKYNSETSQKANYFGTTKVEKVKYFNSKGKKSKLKQLDVRNINMDYIPTLPKNSYPIGDSIYYYTQFDGSPGYDLVMSELYDKIVDGLKIPSSCKCVCASINLSLRIDSDGKIHVINIDIFNDCVKKIVEDSINVIDKWYPVTFSNKPVSVDIEMSIYLEQ